MPYVPPHKRLDASSTPEAMPSRGRGSSCRLSIRYATHSSRKFLVLAPPGSILRLDPFSGQSYHHLTNFHLYTASIANEEDFSSSMERKLTLGDAPSMASLMVEKVLPGFLEALGGVRLLMDQSEPGAVHSKLLFKFGKLIFHSVDGRALPSGEEFDADKLEKCVQGEAGFRVLKTFETSISEDAFNMLKEVASAGAEKIVNKIKYIITFQDAGNPRRKFKCSCVPVSPPCVPTESGSGLQLRKIKYEPLRHMVFDVLCLTKKMDVRLMMFTESRVTDLSDGERDAVQAIVDAAVVDENVKGGLRWPLGKDSFGTLKVERSFQLKKTIIIENERRWIFAAANRAHLEDSTFRLSFEIESGVEGWKSYVTNRDENQDAAQGLLHKLVGLMFQAI